MPVFKNYLSGKKDLCTLYMIDRVNRMCRGISVWKTVVGAAAVIEEKLFSSNDIFLLGCYLLSTVSLYCFSHI